MFSSVLTVPATPTPPQDTVTEFFFSSLQNNQALSNNGTGCAANRETILLQPVLQFGASSAGGGNFWTTGAWVMWGCETDCKTGCSIGVAGLTAANAGDQINGVMFQSNRVSQGGGSYTDNWTVLAQNVTSGAYNYISLNNIPSSWPPFESAQGGVMEMYGVKSCQDLSSSGDITFGSFYAYVGYPYWYSEYLVYPFYSGHSLVTQQPACKFTITSGWNQTLISWCPSC